MTFPTPYTVAHQPYTGLAVDPLNNEVPAWDDTVMVKVIGWRLTQSQEMGDYTSRQVIDGVLLTPPGLEVHVRDRFTLPERPGGMGGTFEVVEVSDVGHGFHQWNPGGVVKLRKTPETRQEAVPA